MVSGVVSGEARGMTLKRMVSCVISGESRGRPKVKLHDAKAYGVWSGFGKMKNDQ